MNKILFFDIDGTLAYHGKIPPSNIQALQLLKEKGYLTFICTGRAVYYAKRLFGDNVSGYIGCNGRYIEYLGEKLLAKPLSELEKTSFISRCINNDIGYLMVGENQSYYGNIDDELINSLIQEYGKDHIDKYDHQEVYTLDLFFNDPNRFEQVENLFKDELVLNNHHQGSCDCTTLSFDKGSAINYLLNHFQISINNSYAFGDGINDTYMFREVSNKIAMGNAIDILKQQATYITDDYDKEGITKALKHFKLI